MTMPVVCRALDQVQGKRSVLLDNLLPVFLDDCMNAGGRTTPGQFQGCNRLKLQGT